MPARPVIGPPDDEKDPADEPRDAAEPEESEPTRLSSFHEGELARRMMAVENRMQGMTDCVFLALFQAAHDLAVHLVNTWEAFGRFCHSRLGVAPQTVLDAWGFPITGDIFAMLKRYEHVKADPAKVEEYFGLICSNWDKRFGE